jgi:acetone carboxylase alpha subunit
MRAQRLAKAKPVSEWIASERERVRAAGFAPEVKKMYASAIRLSPRFTRDFSDFWGVDGKAAFGVE